MDAALRPEARRNDPATDRFQTEFGKGYHREYGSPLFPGPGFKWELNETTKRLLPSVADEPNRNVAPRFALPKVRHLYRWHPDERHYSLVRDDDDDWEEYEDNLYEYDDERLLLRRFHPVSADPRLPRPKPRQPEPPPRQRFFLRPPNGNYTVARDDEYYSPNDLYEYDAKTNQLVRVATRHQSALEPEPPPRRRFFVRRPNGSYTVARDDEHYRRDELYEYDAKTNQFVRVAE